MGFFGVRLLRAGERAEHAVPDDEDPGVVAVEGLLVGAVVHAVVGWRVEDELDRARQPADALGVDPELVDEADRLLRDHSPDGCQSPACLRT